MRVTIFHCAILILGLLAIAVPDGAAISASSLTNQHSLPGAATLAAATGAPASESSLFYGVSPALIWGGIAFILFQSVLITLLVFNFFT